MAGLITGLVSEGWRILNGLMFMVPIGWAPREVPPIQYLYLLGPGLIILGAVTFAWRKPFLGGIVLIVLWILRMVLPVVLDLDSISMIFEAGLWYTWVIPTIFSLLLPASGVLFILSERKVQVIPENVALKTTTIGSGRPEALRLAGLIISLMVGIMYLLQAMTPNLVFILTSVVTGLVIFGGVVLAWKKPFIGGILLIVKSLLPLALVLVAPLFPSSEALGLAMMWGSLPRITIFLCLPLLLSGVFFLLSWREGRKQVRQDAINQ